ncbi:MAG: S4 domain-containing protein, partial [Clostridia bacterium]|nr:S4 domain-containing protein [Clostridia bacterium]
MSEKKRLDMALVHEGLAESREKAQALIMAGLVFQQDVKIVKPSEIVKDVKQLHVRGNPKRYVSRGALKLEKALRVFQAKIGGKVAMDI